MDKFFSLVWASFLTGLIIIACVSLVGTAIGSIITVAPVYKIGITGKIQRVLLQSEWTCSGEAVYDKVHVTCKAVNGDESIFVADYFLVENGK